MRGSVSWGPMSGAVWVHTLATSTYPHCCVCMQIQELVAKRDHRLSDPERSYRMQPLAELLPMIFGTHRMPQL
ncbi:hypothetical protein NXC24_PC01867 (plasmid) [Rhizobium sp. NXC24]|nr:hypothetical protein NXC24_PC01867 [Rhizobium sp. NXC24]